MRLGGSIVMLAILLGATPAPAQESPDIMSATAQPTAKARHAHRHPKPKIAAPRNVAPRIAAPATVVAKTAALKIDSVATEPAVEIAAGLSDSERLKIQSALLWSGDYTGSIGG